MREPPATKTQIVIAKKLGITIPENPTYKQISYLISEKVDKKASDSQMRLFNQLNLHLDKWESPSATKIVFDIDQKIGSQKDIESARWFILSVYMYLTVGKINPVTFGLDTHKSYELAKIFTEEKDALRSMYRDNESGERYNIIQFSSDEFNEGHCVNTKAFLKAKELLKNEFDI